MPKCTFCGKDEKMHKGVHLIKNDGEVSYFCGSKCNANAVKLGRDKRKIRWAEAFHDKRSRQKDGATRSLEHAQELKSNDKSSRQVTREKAKVKAKEVAEKEVKASK